MASRRHPRSVSRQDHHVSRADRREARRDQLLSAALAAIRRLGPDASMEAMAADAGITKPILYRYFGDREGVIAAVADRFGDALVSRLEVELTADMSDSERIRRTIERYVAFIEEDPSLYGFFTHHATVGGPAVRSVIDRVATMVARTLGEGMRSAGVDSAPAETWAYGIVGMVHLAGARWVANPTIPRHRLIEYLTALAGFGLEGAEPDRLRREPVRPGRRTPHRAN